MAARIRIDELMARHKPKLTSAYQLAKVAHGREGLTRATCFRLVEAKGALGRFDAKTLDALAELFGVDVPDLFARSRRR